MYRILTFYLSLILAIYSIAQPQYSSQNVELEWGPVEDRQRHTTHGEFVGYDNTGHYTYRRNKKIDWLGKYNTAMSKEQELALVLSSSSEPQILHFIHVKDKLWIISSETDKKLNENRIYLQEVNKTTLRADKERTQISTIDGDYYKNILNSYLDYFISEDESKLLITYKLPVDADNQRQNKILVFDTKSMQMIWQQTIKFDYDEDHFVLKDKYISNDGNLYFLAKELRSRDELQKDEVQTAKYHLLTFTEKGNNDFELKLADKFINDIKIAINNDGNVIGSGFYSDKSTYSINGCFFITVDVVKGEIVQKSFMEFSIDFIKANLTDKQEKKVDKKLEKGKDVEMYNYELDYLIQREDGGAILVAEFFYIETRSYYDPGCKCYKTTYIYHYNDILVVSIAPDGTIEWNTKIPKRQRSQNPSNLGYCVGWTNNKLFFIFNDAEKNYEVPVYREKGDYYTYPGGRSMVSLATVHLEREGYYEFEGLWNTDVVGGTVFPKTKAEQLNDNVIMLYIQGGKGTQRYVKLNLK